MSFLEAWAKTEHFEGGYSDNPKDAGGPTNHGITEAEARAAGYPGDMREISEISVQRIAKMHYWDTLNLDEIEAISAKIAHELFDTGIHCGPAIAGGFLQMALNAFNHEGEDYPDLLVDGLIGPMTCYALKEYLAKRRIEGETVLLRALNCLQGEYYLRITKDRPQNEEFVYGWFLNRVVI